MSDIDDPLNVLAGYTRELLGRLEEFFIRATGSRATEFATVASFDQTIRANAKKIAPRGESAFKWLDTEVRQYQATDGMRAFRAAKEVGGMRLVLGGSSRFQGSQLRGVWRGLLYGDTVLIPDPVLPWLERERSEERFQHVLVLKAVHCLLHLKPLADADLPYPAVAIFPSWEKSLEDNDEVTQSGISQIVADLVASATGAHLEDLHDVIDFSSKFPDDLLQAADRNTFVVAPGGIIGRPIREALQETADEYAQWRSESWLASYERLPTSRKIITILLERITPIYHLIENAQEFRGSPLMCIEQQAHYFKLVSKLGGSRLNNLRLLDSKTQSALNAISSRRLMWMSNIETNALIKIRQDNGNIEFRRIIADAVARLDKSDLDDIDAVASEVCHSLDIAISNFNNSIADVRANSRNNHVQTLVLGAGTLGAMLIPSLMPLLGVAAPFALAAKYTHDKLHEIRQERNLRQSMIGVLASAKDDG